MNQTHGTYGRQRDHRHSWWTYALIAVTALASLTVGLVVVGLVMSALSHGVMGGNK
jgi:hypothetical protein